MEILFYTLNNIIVELLDIVLYNFVLLIYLHSGYSDSRMDACIAGLLPPEPFSQSPF